MSIQQIQVLMSRLSNMHKQFEQNNYHLSSLDKQTIKNTIEQLNSELIIEQTALNFHNSKSQEITEPYLEDPFLSNGHPYQENNLAPETSYTSSENIDKPIDDVNNEIDELFFPKVAHQVSSRNEKRPIDLGINERIMFAKELFENDTNALQNKVREFQEYHSKDLALQKFDNHLMPTLLEQGKDEEIVAEFRGLIARLY